MKKILISTCFMLLSLAAFSQSIAGKWTSTIDTDNGSFTFFAEYKVDGETLTGKLYSDYGTVQISNGTIKGNEFEYTFEIEYNTLKHKGKLVDGELKMTMTSNNGDTEFTMTAVKEE